MKINFLRTVTIIFKNKFVNPYFAVFRHILWALRRLFDFFPCDLKLGKQVVRVANRSVANGNGALINAVGYYDPNNMLLLKELFQTGVYNLFFDVGANIGVYSLVVAGQVESVNVFAFEPHPETFLLLQENVRINNLEKCISCFQIALGNHNGIVQFVDKAGNPENHVLDELVDNGLKVEIHRAEKICKEKGVYPQVLKIDVEGYENQVILGFGEMLYNIELIFVECWSLEKTIDILCGEYGFLGPFKADYKNHCFVSEDISSEDWIFVNPKAEKKLELLMSFNSK